MRRMLLVLVLLCACLLPGVSAAQSEEGPLLIAREQQYSGSVATSYRDIRVEGSVIGDVTSLNGTIEILGHVTGDVVSYSGNVIVRGGASVEGNILATSGHLQLDNGALVAGQPIRGVGGSVALANLLDLFTHSADEANDTIVGNVLLGLAVGVFLLAFSLLAVAFWPRRTAAVGLALRRMPGRALLLGMLSTLLLALALPPLIALMAATLIGLPLLVVLLVLIQAPYIYGLVAVARAAGSDLAHAAAGINRRMITVVGVLALVVAVSMIFTPLGGLLVFYLLASPGLGAVLLSRGGLVVPAYK